MSSKDTAAEIRDFVVTQYLSGEDASDLTDDYDLIESGVIDSLGLVRLISHISQAYDVPLDDIEFGPVNFRSINAITDLITSHTEALAA
ncbi:MULTISPECIES: acyl carrier protein [unclassified Streptomyces]|uniref:acyl carrier protein n=1 Tax=unclassified Streptomyces TaxID=2593676 RepID=UPI0006AFD2FB|nr:acyl carrier protein [Streptomyces sp. WM6378]KOU53793.1 phosphopantetheine attachment site family protein [Streptomyces sp. WM6378]